MKRRRSCCRLGVFVAASCFLSSVAAFTSVVSPSTTTTTTTLFGAPTATAPAQEKSATSEKEWKENAAQLNKSFHLEDSCIPSAQLSKAQNNWDVPSQKASNDTPRRKTVSSRSSTMRSFAHKSERQYAYAKGIRLAELKSGITIKESRREQTNRLKTNSRHMYTTSSSVPDSMVQFATEIHREARITRSEEIDLGEKAQEGIRVKSIFDSLEQQFGREPTDEEWCAAAGKINVEAISQAMEEGLEAKNRLVTSNLRMVQSVVNTYIRNGLGARYNAGDLMQEGVMALIRAAEKYEPDRGFKFSTYAMYWVRSSVKRSHVLQSRSIPVPQRLYDRNKQLRRIEEDMMIETGGLRPTWRELGHAIGISEKQVESCFRAMDVRCHSIDAELTNRNRASSGGDRGSATAVELIEDVESTKAQQELLREDLIKSMKKHLDPVHMELLLLRYGVRNTESAAAASLIGKLQPMDGKQITVAEMSRRLGMKPWKIRQAIDQSLATLKAAGVDEWRGFAEEMQ